MFCSLAKVLGNLEFALADVLVEDIDIVVVEGWDTYKHLVQHYADLVDIARGRDARLAQHLRRQVGWTAAE